MGSTVSVAANHNIINGDVESRHPGGGGRRSGGLSAEKRWYDIHHFATEYFDFLSSTKGAVLSAETRLQIASMARQALDCPGCASLPKDACLRPGVDIYKTIESLETHHGTSKDDDGKKMYVLLNLVHSIVSHQGRLNESWYGTTLEKLDGCGWIDETMAPTGSEKHRYLLYTLFSEVVLVTTLVQCLDMAFLVAGEPLLDLPKVSSSDATSPTGFDWSLAVKAGTSPTTKGCWAPYFVPSDVDPNSVPFRSLDVTIRENHLTCGMESMTPFVSVNWSVVDMAWFIRMDELLYVEWKDVVAMWRPLSPEKRCAQAFLRRDVEVVASAIADSYNCVF